MEIKNLNPRKETTCHAFAYLEINVLQAVFVRLLVQTLSRSYYLGKIKDPCAVTHILG